MRKSNSTSRVLGTLLKKEIAETMLDFRFFVTSLLCMVLIPLGMYVSRKDYEQRFDTYQRRHQTYREQYGTPEVPVTGWEEAHGFRPPSVLGILASGLAPFLPDRVITFHTGFFRAIREPAADNPQSLLFGKADLLYSVVFIISLAALIFTFNSISGEKEMGTLRLMIANPVPRGQILLCKVFGKYTAILVPFTVSMLLALLVLAVAPGTSIELLQNWCALTLVLLLTLLFIFDMVALGICLSTLTKHSMGSIVLVFLVWTMFILTVPRVTPMIAEIIHPVEASTVVDFTKRVTREDIEREYEQLMEPTESRWTDEWSAACVTADRMKREIAARVRNSGREPTAEDFEEARRILDERGLELRAKYQPRIDRFKRECQAHIFDEIKRIEQDHRNAKSVQYSIAANLARISPVSCYAYAATGLCGTGVDEPDNFIRNAHRFQEQVDYSLYDKAKKSGKGMGRSTSLSLPDMVYRYATVAETLQTHWPDLLLLGVFGLLFYSLAFMRFNTYDVR